MTPLATLAVGQCWRRAVSGREFVRIPVGNSFSRGKRARPRALSTVLT